MRHLFMTQYLNFLRQIHLDTHIHKPPWKVLFFGTDAFSLYSLEALYKEYQSSKLLRKLEIVTTVKQRANPIQKFAQKENLPIHPWPGLLPNGYDVGLVVSFGHLIPEVVINQFPLGILNVHASLLPRWRGAAPIIYALANGDTETGVTIMQIKPKHFDIGDIIMQESTVISKDMNLPELHARLGNMGASCLMEVLHTLPDVLLNAKPQPTKGVTFAPKISPEFAVVCWTSMTSKKIYDLERATKDLFAPTCSWHGIQIKLLDIEDCGKVSGVDFGELCPPGSIHFEKKSKTLRILCFDKTCISVRNIGVIGKKVMSAVDFYNGFISKEPLERRIFS